MDTVEVFKKFCKDCNKEFVSVSNDKEFDKLVDPFTYWKKLPVTLSFLTSTEEEAVSELYRKLRNFTLPTTFYDAFSVNSQKQIMGRINTKNLWNR